MTHTRSGVAAVLTAFLITGCGGGGNDNPVAEAPPSAPPPAEIPAPTPNRPIAVEFDVKANNVAVKCGDTINGLGTAGTTASLRDLRFYLSHAALLTDQGEAVPITLTPDDFQNSEVTLIDLEDGSGDCAGTAAMNTAIRGTVPADKTYTGIQFVVGVPHALNHSDYAVATAPMDVQALAWSWQAGRKYLQIELDPVGGVARPAPAAASNTWYLHLGATNCSGNPVTGETVSCARPNRMDFKADRFDAGTQKIVVNLSTLYATSNLSVDAGSAPGCMSGLTDPECGAIFDALRIDFPSGQPVAQGAGQQLFVVESK